jgi:hypothetical protein
MALKLTRIYTDAAKQLFSLRGRIKASNDKDYHPLDIQIIVAERSKRITEFFQEDYDKNNKKVKKDQQLDNFNIASNSTTIVNTIDDSIYQSPANYSELYNVKTKCSNNNNNKKHNNIFYNTGKKQQNKKSSKNNAKADKANHNKVEDTGKYITEINNTCTSYIGTPSKLTNQMMTQCENEDKSSSDLNNDDTHEGTKVLSTADTAPSTPLGTQASGLDQDGLAPQRSPTTRSGIG